MYVTSGIEVNFIEKYEAAKVKIIKVEIVVAIKGKMVDTSIWTCKYEGNA